MLLPPLVSCVASWELYAREGGGAGAAAQVFQSVLRALSEGPCGPPSAAEERLWIDYAATMADCCWGGQGARPAHVHAALVQVGVDGAAAVLSCRVVGQYMERSFRRLYR